MTKQQTPVERAGTQGLLNWRMLALERWASQTVVEVGKTAVKGAFAFTPYASITWFKFEGRYPSRYPLSPILSSSPVRYAVVLTPYTPFVSVCQPLRIESQRHEL